MVQNRKKQIKWTETELIKGGKKQKGENAIKSIEMDKN